MDMEERVERLEKQTSKQDERLDRHSKRLHSLEDGFMKESVEMAAMKKDVENIDSRTRTIGSRMERMECNLYSLSKWMKAIAVLVVVTLVVVLFKDKEAAGAIAKTAAPLVGGVV